MCQLFWFCERESVSWWKSAHPLRCPLGLQGALLQGLGEWLVSYYILTPNLCDPVNVLADIVLVWFSLPIIKYGPVQTQERRRLNMIALAPLLTAVLSVVYGVSFVVRGGQYERIFGHILVCVLVISCVETIVHPGLTVWDSYHGVQRSSSDTLDAWDLYPI